MNATLSHDDIQRVVYRAIGTVNPGIGLNLTYEDAMTMPLPYLTEFVETLIGQQEALAKQTKG